LIKLLFLAFLNYAVFLQGVHSTLDGCPGSTWGPDEKRINKLVFIGRNLDETTLRKGFKGCLA
jgi:G3E family GTPase